MPTKQVILPKSEYDRIMKLMQACPDSSFTFDEFLAHKILENEKPEVRKTIDLQVSFYGTDGKLFTTVNIPALMNDEQRTRDYFYRGYRITVEPYGTRLAKYQAYRFFVLPKEATDGWEYKDNGYTGISYAIKWAKKAIDEHLENAEWLGFHNFNGYKIEIAQHGIKGHKKPFFKYVIHDWDGDSDDAVQYAYKKAVHALDAAEGTIKHFLDSQEDEGFLTVIVEDDGTILDDAMSIVDYAVNRGKDENYIKGMANPVIDNPVPTDDGYWETTDESAVDNDAYWSDC